MKQNWDRLEFRITDHFLFTFDPKHCFQLGFILKYLPNPIDSRALYFGMRVDDIFLFGNTE